LNDIGSTDRGFHACASTAFAWPDLALHGMFECLDAAGIDGRLPARYIEAARGSGAVCAGTEGELEGDLRG